MVNASLAPSSAIETQIGTPQTRNELTQLWSLELPICKRGRTERGTRSAERGTRKYSTSSKNTGFLVDFDHVFSLNNRPPPSPAPPWLPFFASSAQSISSPPLPHPGETFTCELFFLQEKAGTDLPGPPRSSLLSTSAPPIYSTSPSPTSPPPHPPCLLPLLPPLPPPLPILPPELLPELPALHRFLPLPRWP